MLGLGGAISLAAAINLITALIAILPDAVISIIPEVARYLEKLELNARVLSTGIQTDTRTDIWTSLRKSVDESGKTILPAWPFGDREISGLGKVVCLANVPAILFVVEPLSGIRCSWQRAVEIFDVDLIAGVDRQTRGAFFVSAELELAGSDILTQTGFGVLVGVECQIVARSSLEEVAFAYILSVSLP